MKQSTSSRRQPLVIMITTSGTVRESVFDNIYELACNIADGKITENTFLPILYELDDRAEWTDPQAWIKANPGLGAIKRYATLASFVERAKKNPEDLPGVLCKDFNVKAVSAAAWLSYQRKEEKRWKTARKTGDLSLVSSLCASVCNLQTMERRCVCPEK